MFNVDAGREVRWRERLQSQEPATLNEWVSTFHEDVFRLMKHLTKNREVAEDLTQQTFVKAWRAIRTFDGRSSMRVNKFGVPVQSGPSKKSLSIDPSQLGILGLDKVKDLVVGKEIPIDEKSATGTVKGKAKILEIDKDVLKVATDVEVTSDKTGAPMHLKTVAQIDYAKSQINRVDGEILSGLPEQGGVTIDSLKFTMIRIN